MAMTKGWRLAGLAVVGAIAASWAIVLEREGGTVPTALAAPALEQPVAQCPFPATQRRAFEVAAADTKLPPGLLFAVAKVESNLMPNVRSAAGARGLLQVMPATAQALALNVDSLEMNVLAGARFLRLMVDRFGNMDLALAAYNAGPTAVANAGGAPSAAVQRYVQDVEDAWNTVAGCA